MNLCHQSTGFGTSIAPPTTAKTSFQLPSRSPSRKARLRKLKAAVEEAPTICSAILRLYDALIAAGQAFLPSAALVAEASASVKLARPASILLKAIPEAFLIACAPGSENKVRPIVFEEKQGSPLSFGAKSASLLNNGFHFFFAISWECIQTKWRSLAQAEKYTQRINGLLPERSAADRIYINRENGTSAMRNGIRLSGQAFWVAPQRNPILNAAAAATQC